MFDFLGRFLPNNSRFCAACGRPTSYRRCDQCAFMRWSEPDIQAIAAQPTQPLPIIQPHQPPAHPSCRSAHLTPEQMALLASVPPDETPDDAPFPGPAGQPQPTPLLLGDWCVTPAMARHAREALPPIRDDWSACCPWCLREMFELDDLDALGPLTHEERLAIRTCPRHHEGQLALLDDLRSGDWRTRYQDDPPGSGNAETTGAA